MDSKLKRLYIFFLKQDGTSYVKGLRDIDLEIE